MESKNKFSRVSGKTEKRKTGEILRKVLGKITPTKKEMDSMKEAVSEFKKRVEKRIRELKIKAVVFIGGSFAKKTMISKEKYDIDFFIRFLGKEEGISELTKKILKNFKKREINGSRNYFIIDKGKFFIEVIPTLKVNNPRKAENVTDLSYSHVNYIRKKTNSKILEEIKLAKAFCYANKCYGAESYIRGFSGYALELLVYHYGSFFKFIKAFEKIKDKTVIDIEKHFKNRNEVFIDVNDSKLKSPIILIDPTYKSRNALAALSYETFREFQKACKDFLRNPSEKFFELKSFDVEKFKIQTKKKKLDFAEIQIRTEKQEGDIAGTKLLKFYKHLISEVERNYKVKEKHFSYDGRKNADCFFAAERKKEIIFSGPSIKQEENVKEFRKKHKIVFTKNGRIYAREKIKENLREFLRSWKRKYEGKIKEMGISEMKIV